MFEKEIECQEFIEAHAATKSASTTMDVKRHYAINFTATKIAKIVDLIECWHFDSRLLVQKNFTYLYYTVLLTVALLVAWMNSLYVVLSDAPNSIKLKRWSCVPQKHANVTRFIRFSLIYKCVGGGHLCSVRVLLWCTIRTPHQKETYVSKKYHQTFTQIPWRKKSTRNHMKLLTTYYSQPARFHLDTNHHRQCSFQTSFPYTISLHCSVTCDPVKLFMTTGQLLNKNTSNFMQVFHFLYILCYLYASALSVSFQRTFSNRKFSFVFLQ